MRVPCTPGGVLAGAVKVVVDEEAGRLGLKVKTQEGSGLPLRRSVVTSDLGAGQPCHQGDCTLCLSGDDKGGLRHHRSGAVYKGECKLCGEGISDYWGESGDSAYCRCQQHKSAILNKDENNAFAKHLAIHHPEQEGNIDSFRFKLVETHSQPLSRLCSESVHIHTSKAQIPMNSKAEWHAPVVPRVVVTRELEELEQQGGAGRGRGGRGRPAGGARGRRQRGGA